MDIVPNETLFLHRKNFPIYFSNCNIILSHHLYFPDTVLFVLVFPNPNKTKISFLMFTVENIIHCFFFIVGSGFSSVLMILWFVLCHNFMKISLIFSCFFFSEAFLFYFNMN